MEFKPFYLGCLSHASYLLASEGDAAVIDPQRDVAGYLAEAEKLGAKIRWIIETHLHADFVSGHRELAERTGATIVFGHRAGATMKHLAVRDGDGLPLGRIRLRVMETPGHTLEGISLLLESEKGEPSRLFTGDTLFIGDVGRPDLVAAKGHTPEEMASFLYDSLRDKILPLPDHVEIWPAHGAGSACGKNISDEAFSTLGVQRRSNYALQPMSREAFVKAVTNGLPPVPKYFSHDVELNRSGAPAIDDLPAPPELSPSGAESLLVSGALALDVRRSMEFGEAHMRGAVNLGLSGQFAHWAGSLLEMDRSLVLIASAEEQAREAFVRLARVGFHTVRGWMRMKAWQLAGKSVMQTRQVTVRDLAVRSRPVRIADVRRPGEYRSAHAPGAVNLPLDRLAEEAPRALDAKEPWAVICASGYRSSAACGLLESLGYTCENVVGGTQAWIEAGLPTEKEPASEHAS